MALSSRIYLLSSAKRLLTFALIAVLYGLSSFFAIKNGSPKPFFAIIIPILLSLAAFNYDLERDELGLDDFQGDHLFFRYGEWLSWVVIPIPIREGWTVDATKASALTLRATLAQQIARRLSMESIKVIAQKTIRDLSTGEEKEFTRVRIQSRFGSSITFFIHYAVFGQTITAQYFTFQRGVYSWGSIARFALASPLTIWFWGVSWLRNRFSVVSTISEFRTSSFDAIDLETMYKVAHRVIFEETTKLLRAAKLLTPEIEQIIHFHIESVQNFQSIMVSDSPNTRIGDVAQSAGAHTEPVSA